VSADYTTDDMMIVAASRALRDGMVCFVGIGLPSTAANLARLTHAPGVVLIYESGCIGAKPYRLPLSIGDGVLAETADTVVSVPEIFAYWLQAGRVDVGFLGGAQLDRFGSINSTVIGTYDKPTVRLPGAGGAPEIAASAGEVFVIVRQSARTFVDKVDFVSSVGAARQGLGLRGKGTTLVVTDLGLLRADAATGELVLSGLHPGVTVDQVRAATGWDLAVAGDLPVTEPPSPQELAALRSLQAAS
jgi:glutaconate CoA-transferase subunit B